MSLPKRFQRQLEQASVDKHGIPRTCAKMTYPFHSLALCGHLDMVKKYVSLGVAVDCRDKQGRTALHEACCRKTGMEMIKYLVVQGADVMATDSLGETPLHCVARHTKQSFAASFLVVECKASLTWLNQFGQTPLDVAKEANYSLLSSLGIDPVTLTSDNEHFERLPDVIQFLLVNTGPFSLRELCKNRIMSQLGFCEGDRLHKLPLPTRLKCYLGGTLYVMWLKEHENETT